MSERIFIVNPIAGNGRCSQAAKSIAARMRELEKPFEMVWTQRPGHATELAREAAHNFQSVISVGGDGTLREVAIGLAGLDGAVLGMIPAGTGNDYPRSLNIPEDPMAALEILLQNNIRTIDMGTFNGTAFLNVASVGFDADVVEKSWRFRAMKKLAYFTAVFSSLISYTNKPLTIDVDSQQSNRNLFLAAVGNGGYYGGGMHVLPAADLSDGTLDLCLVCDLPRIMVPVLMPLFMQGKHETIKKYVRLLRCKHFSARSSKPFNAQVDGELIRGITSAEIGILPGALRVLCARP